MKNDLTVTICMFNAEKFIVETLESLYHQTKKQFNLLILDDASTDKSVAVADTYLKLKDWKNCEIIQFKSNRGLAYLRNDALNMVETEYMFFNDADDIAHTNLLEQLYLKITSEKNINVVSCYAKYIDENSKPLPGGLFFGPTTEEEFYNRCKENKMIWMNAASMFKVEAARKAGGWNLKGFPKDSKVRYQDLAEDVDMWNRIADFYIDGEIMLTIPRVLRDYRKNPFSLSSGKQNTFALQNRIRQIKKNMILRREGNQELTYLEFINKLTLLEKTRYFFVDHSAYYYKLAGMNYMKRSYLQFIFNLSISIIYNPKYLIMKIKNNNIKKKNG